MNPTTSANKDSRPAIIALCTFTLRFMGNWRTAMGAILSEETDFETTLVIVAIVAIGAEKFSRSGLDDGLRDLAAEMPTGFLARCNLSSIASATGLNREKVRRKVDRLERQGMLEREPNGAIRVRAQVAARPEVRQLIAAQEEALRHLDRQMTTFVGGGTG